MSSAEPFENPLIPNARLRQMYLAMLRARRLEEVLPPKQRAWTAGLEACLVAPVIDLTPGDLISDAVTGGVIAFLRGASLESIMTLGKKTRRPGLLSDAGAAPVLPPAPGVSERLWAAVGAAIAVRAVGGGAESAAAGRQRGAVVAYVRPPESTPALRRAVLGFAAEHLLPVIFVLLPAANARAADAGWTAAAGQSGIPSIAVDRDDAVAIYRVAQESIGRARAGGGPAMIECVPFAVAGSRGDRKTGDALANIERYILERSIATPEWFSRESRVLARRLGRPVH